MFQKRIDLNLLNLMEQRYDKKISRREFVRYAALLGASVAGAYGMVGLSAPKNAYAAGKKAERGGTLKIITSIQKATHPARFFLMSISNIFRNVAEYLTWTDKDNITHPYLLENWKASLDLKTWTLNLKKGIRFNNGDELTVDDVIFSLKQWLDKDVGSSILGLMGGYLSPSGIERSGKYQVKLHLKHPEIAVPEHLFHYPALILNHKTFEGDFIKAPHGTGPYVMEMYREGELCRLTRRPDENPYWQNGADGKPLPYMDGMEFIDMGSVDFYISGLYNGKADMADPAGPGSIEIYKALKNDPRFKIKQIPSARTHILNMRADLKPWNDNRVRMALKLCQRREKLLALVYSNQGLFMSPRPIRNTAKNRFLGIILKKQSIFWEKPGMGTGWMSI